LIETADDVGGGTRASSAAFEFGECSADDMAREACASGAELSIQAESR
jgi:hypothetical protein